MIPSTPVGFLGLLVASFIAGAGWSFGAWVVARIFR